MESIEALKALPQCITANIEMTEMSAKKTSKVKKARGKKERSKPGKAHKR